MRSVKSERGAVATIVAMLLGGAVIFGLLAMAVDVGALMVERRQLQNGADAAAMSLAQSCAQGACVAGANDLSGLTNANARDGAHTLAGQCLMNKPSSLSSALPACPASSLAAPDCPPLPDTYASLATTLPYVEVRTSTSSNGASTLTNVFRRAGGNDPTSPADESSTDIHACSRAAWGTPGGATATTPITISVCEWQKYTNGGASWVANPPTGAWPGYNASTNPYPPPFTTPNTSGREQMLTLHDPSKPPCSFNGKDTAGGFGYLQPTGSCEATIVTNGSDQWANIDTGSSATNDCKTRLADIYANGPVVDIPVFDCIVKSTTGTPTGGIAGKDCTGAGASGAGSYYHIAGWAKFYISGYKIGGGPDTERPSRVGLAVPCSGAVRCLSGWFVRGPLAGAATVVPPTSGSNFGSYAVIPVG